MEDELTRTEAYSTNFKHLSDLKEWVGKELGLSNWVTINQERIDAFAGATEDHQWIHVNPEKSKLYSPYKTTVAHGFLVLSFASKFAYDCYSIDDVTMGVNYGLNKVRFPNATPAGALVRGRISLLSYEEKPGGARYILKVVFEIKGKEKPACVAEFIAQAYADSNQTAELEDFGTIDIDSPQEADKTVLYEKNNKIAIITLNRPDRYNAVTPKMNEELSGALWKARKDDEVRAIVITGAGKGFCAGADLDVFGKLSPDEGREYITATYQPLMRNFLSLKKPIIGAINGTAAGVGASIALACDLRVMGEKSALLCAFINIGLGPDGGASWLLARQVGYSRAMQFAIEGKKILATECLKLGLTNKLSSNEEVLSTAMAWAKELAKRPTLAVGITKEDMVFAMDNNLQDTIAFEAEKQMAAFASHDLIEGVSAFIEKRPAVFIGK